MQYGEARVEHHNHEEVLETTAHHSISQVHIRTSPDASPESVGVFVGSDPTNSVAAPCEDVENPVLKQVYTHTPPVREATCKKPVYPSHKT